MTEQLPALHALTISPVLGSAATDARPPAESPLPRSDGAPPEPTARRSPTPRTKATSSFERYDGPITYRAYRGEDDIDAIFDLVDDELSEPYNLYTYRYFLDDWCVPLLRHQRIISAAYESPGRRIDS